jgi:hypothetical protein
MAKSLTKRTTNPLLLGSTAVLTIAIGVAVTVIPGDGPQPVVATAQAQGVSISVQFRSGLEPYGRWTRHPRWGEVWIPAYRDRDWRPYTEGRWIYTDEWGWFWDSDEDFGWIAYHYGRWVLDPQFGWVWIPGDEWGPAWVQWRRGDRYAGWAPLPPQPVIYEYDNDPNYWIFVGFNNFTARNIRLVVVPPQERVVIVRQTVIVNRTIIVDRGPRIAVNPGIEPRIVAARVGRPIQVANVKPVVVAGTAGVQNAVEVRADQKRQERVRPQIAEKKETIAPAKEVPPPQALKRGEEGKLGDRPPTAAKEMAQPPAGTKGQPDAAKGPDTTKGPDTAKSKVDDAAKAKDTAKSAPVDTKAEPKSQVKDATKTDPAAGAKGKMDDARTRDTVGGKSKTDDFAKGKMEEKSKQPSGVGKGPQQDGPGVGKADVRRDERPDRGPDRQVMPKSEPRQSPPEMKQQSVPKGPPDQPRAAAPQSPPPGAAGGPKQDGPKGSPAGAKGKGEEKEKGRGG